MQPYRYPEGVCALAIRLRSSASSFVSGSQTATFQSRHVGNVRRTSSTSITIFSTFDNIRFEYKKEKNANQESRFQFSFLIRGYFLISSRYTCIYTGFKICFGKKIKIEIDNVGTTFVLVFLESRQGRSTISRRGFLAPRRACAFDRWTYVRVNTDPADAIYSRNWIKPSEKVPLLSKAFGINMRPIRLRCPLEEIL